MSTTSVRVIAAREQLIARGLRRCEGALQRVRQRLMIGCDGLNFGGTSSSPEARHMVIGDEVASEGQSNHAGPQPG
jgi:hypothetical protein